MNYGRNNVWRHRATPLLRHVLKKVDLNWKDYWWRKGTLNRTWGLDWMSTSYCKPLCFCVSLSKWICYFRRCWSTLKCEPELVHTFGRYLVPHRRLVCVCGRVRSLRESVARVLCQYYFASGCTGSIELLRVCVWPFLFLKKKKIIFVVCQLAFSSLDFGVALTKLHTIHLDSVLVQWFWW